MRAAARRFCPAARRASCSAKAAAAAAATRSISPRLRSSSTAHPASRRSPRTPTASTGTAITRAASSCRRRSLLGAARGLSLAELLARHDTYSYFDACGLLAEDRPDSYQRQRFQINTLRNLTRSNESTIAARRRARRCSPPHEDRRDAGPGDRRRGRHRAADPRGHRRVPRQLLARHGRPIKRRASHACARSPTRVGRHIGIMGDLQGPKIRVESFKAGPVDARRRATSSCSTSRWTRTPATSMPSAARTAISRNDVVAGDTLLLDDGLIVLEVEKVEGTRIHCRVKQGGRLADHKGLEQAGRRACRRPR